MQEPLHGICYAIEKIEMSKGVSSLSGDELEALTLSLRGLEMSSTPDTDSVDVDTSTENKGKLVTFGDHLEREKGAGLMIGQLISDVTEALRLCFLSCPVRYVDSLTYAFGWSAFFCRIRFCDTLVEIFFLCKHYHH
jgi:hypothetical protein